MRIAFRGTGTMGAPMARHLLAAGHDVAVWNRTRAKAEPLAEHGARVADTAAEAAVGAEALVTMLADGGAVADAVTQAAPAPGTLWWQASTVGIAGIEALDLLARERGLTLVDAPVLGTKAPAEEGKLVVLASGPGAALDRCAPLFDAVGSRTMRVGEAGAATRLKLVCNLWVLAVTTGLAETITYAEGLDVDPAQFLEAIAGGALDIGYAKLKGPGMIAGELPVAFALAMALKDADLMLEA